MSVDSIRHAAASGTIIIIIISRTESTTKSQMAMKNSLSSHNVQIIHSCHLQLYLLRFFICCCCCYLSRSHLHSIRPLPKSTFMCASSFCWVSGEIFRIENFSIEFEGMWNGSGKLDQLKLSNEMKGLFVQVWRREDLSLLRGDVQKLQTILYTTGRNLCRRHARKRIVGTQAMINWIFVKKNNLKRLMMCSVVRKSLLTHLKRWRWRQRFHSTKTHFKWIMSLNFTNFMIYRRT